MSISANFFISFAHGIVTPFFVPFSLFINLS